LLAGSLVAAFACGGGDTKPAVAPVTTGSGTVAPVSNTAPVAAVTGSGVAGSGTGTGKTTPVGPVSFGNNKPIVASTMLDKLTAAGLDPKNLPALDKMSQKQLAEVMKTFTKATGWKCEGCHAPSSFTASHPMKNVTRHMWNEYVKGISFDGGPLYCDSCHQGKASFLDKSDKKALAAWMDAEYTKRMKRNGQAQTCATCHGEPFKPEFIEDWKKK
jgi:Cytochrome c7 and related cytochrome c